MRERCPITDEQIHALVDNELAERETKLVAAHVVACESCSTMVGGALAGKRLLGAGSRAVDVPANSWDRVIATLDDADSVAHATIPVPARRRIQFGSVPALAASGLILICAALVLQSRARETMGLTPLFIRSHVAAVANFAGVALAPRDTLHEVVTARTNASDWVPVARWLIPYEGEFVDHTLYRVDDRCRISEFIVSGHLLDLDGLAKATVKGADFWLRADQGGSIVVWENAGLMHVLVGRTNAPDLLAIAATRRATTPLMRGL